MPAQIPAQPFYDLIQANRQDQLVTRYDTYKELEDYCKLSANPVGQVVLYIMGAATPERFAASDSICTALQVIEHCQDVAEDFANGRIYLPRDDMDSTPRDRGGPRAADRQPAGAGPGQVRGRTARDALLDDGAPLVGTLHGVATAGHRGLRGRRVARR